MEVWNIRVCISVSVCVQICEQGAGWVGSYFVCLSLSSSQKRNGYIMGGAGLGWARISGNVTLAERINIRKEKREILERERSAWTKGGSSNGRVSDKTDHASIIITWPCKTRTVRKTPCRGMHRVFYLNVQKCLHPQSGGKKAVELNLQLNRMHWCESEWVDVWIEVWTHRYICMCDPLFRLDSSDGWTRRTAWMTNSAPSSLWRDICL